MTTKRLQDSATALAHLLGHKDVGSTDPDKIAEFKATATPEQLEKFKNSWREVDAVNYGMKLFRELRGHMLAGRSVDLMSMATEAATHYGDTRAELVAEVLPIKAALEAEQSAFAAEIKANAADLKAGKVRYNLGEVLNPALLSNKTPAQIADIIAKHDAIPLDEFIPAEKTKG